MNNYKLVIQYDGTKYAGWQIQNNAVTIQKRICDCIKIITKEDVNLIGSGRTDAGVHALGQTANFKFSTELNLYKFKHSLNAILPPEISVISIEKVYDDFHARFDAKKRSYIYLFSKFKSPFYQNYSYFYHRDLEINTLNNISRLFIGQKDFTSFAKKNTDTKNKVCNVYSAAWKEIKDIIIFYIEADRFLHGMVRTIIGTLLESAKSGYSEDLIKNVLKAKDRNFAGESVPARGLFLYKVKY